MPCLTSEVADAVTTALNEGPLAGATPIAVAVRKWYVQYTLQELAHLKITVCPGRWDEERHSREGFQHIRYVYVIVQQKIDPGDNGPIDALMGLVEQFFDFLTEDTGLEVNTESGMPFILDEPPKPINPAQCPVDPVMLAELRIFTTAMELKMVSRTPGAAGSLMEKKMEEKNMSYIFFSRIFFSASRAVRCFP